ncbi:MAG: ferrochelatase, partial [Planctomycetota bacterium]
PFYDHPAYIGAIAALARPVLEELQPERVIMSYHGVPERHVTKSDPSGSHCLAQESCCETVCPANRNCYRMHCVQTTRKLTAALGLAEETVRLSFQSRLGKDPWLRPYTDEVIEELGAEGIKRACILSPAFTADCLETIEELGMRGAEDFKKAGGGRLALVPSLNATAPWVEAVCTIAGEASPWARRAV